MRQAPGEVEVRSDPVNQALDLVPCRLDWFDNGIFYAIPCARRLGFDPFKNAGGSALYRIERVADSCLYSIYHRLYCRFDVIPDRADSGFDAI